MDQTGETWTLLLTDGAHHEEQARVERLLRLWKGTVEGMSEEQMTTDPWAGLRAPAESVGRHVDDSPLDDLTTRQLARSFVFGDLKRWALKQAPLEDQSEDDHTKYMGVGFTNPLTKSKRLRTKYGLEDVQSYRFPLIIAGRRVSHLLFWAPALLFPFIVLGILSIVQ